MNFSRRKLTQPRPPLPAWTLMEASSTNFIGVPSGSTDENPGARPGLSVNVDGLPVLFGHHAHEGVALRPLPVELHLAGDQCEQCVVRAGAHVDAGAHRRAALPYENVPSEDGFTAELLHAEALAVG